MKPNLVSGMRMTILILEYRTAENKPCQLEMFILIRRTIIKNERKGSKFLFIYSFIKRINHHGWIFPLSIILVEYIRLPVCCDDVFLITFTLPFFGKSSKEILCYTDIHSHNIHSLLPAITHRHITLLLSSDTYHIFQYDEKYI